MWIKQNEGDEPISSPHDYSMLICWDDDSGNMYLMDNVKKMMVATSSLDIFLEGLRQLPNDINVDWVDTCTVSRSWGMTEKSMKRVSDLIKSKNIKYYEPGAKTTACYCESNGLRFIEVKQENPDEGNFSFPEYSFSSKPYVHPKIIEELGGYISDGGDQIVTINITDSQDSNRFHEDFEIVEQMTGYPVIKYKDEYDGFFEYRFLGTLHDDIIVLQTTEYGGGSGIFERLMFVEIIYDERVKFSDPDFHEDGVKRQLVKKLGAMSLGDRWYGDIKLSGHTVLVGPDRGWYSKSDQISEKRKRGYKFEVFR